MFWVWIGIGLALVAIVTIGLVVFFKRRNKKQTLSAHSQLDTLEEQIEKSTRKLEELNVQIERANAEKEVRTQEWIAATENLSNTNKQANNDLIARQKQLDTLREQLNTITEEVAVLTGKKALLITDVAVKKQELAELIENHRQMEIRAAQKDLEEGEVLPLEEWEKDELKELEEVAKKLRNATPLYKAIYEIYYAGALKKLVADCGANAKCGIYRLWVVVPQDEVGESAAKNSEPRVLNYVGQSVDIGERWAQHIKRGLGLDTVGTTIQLYPAMRKYGIENFHWEVLEECGKEELGERETFWGNYYAVKEVGLNKKLG